ncbi:MAG: amino acid permease [Candidatus Cloacimonadota bacterium]|nr:amino acid permease [Candidatus Cloacimonadota bacterium]
MAILKKELGLLSVFSIAAGAMISSGLFILPGLAYFKSGPAVILAYLLAGILVLPSMFSKAELATAMPKSGGTYFFINRSMGGGFGTIAGISAWFSIAFKSAFALVGIGAFASIIYPDITIFQIKLIAVVFCVFFTIINLKSTKHAGRLQVFMVIGLLVLLLYYVIKGIPHVDNRHFDDFMIGDLKTLFMTSGLIFVSYGGLTKIASVAEEVKNPSRNIPLGMISAFTIVTIAYVVVVFVTVGTLGDKLLLPAPKLYSLTPISDGAAIFAGKPGMYLLSIAALLAFFSTANAGIMAASRNPMAMSQDKLLPSFFGKVNKKHQTPVNAILFTSGFMILVIFLPLETLVKTASTMMLLLFIFVNISVIIMRESGIQNYRPKFKSPLYPWLQILAVLAYTFLIIEMGVMPLILTFVLIITGLAMYWFYGRIRSNKESALFQLVKRIKAKDLVTTSLETELKEIIRERDNITKDRFDELIERAVILDIDKAISKEEFFHIIADKVCVNINKSSDYFYEKLLEREAESSTVLTDSLAIPHIIIEGERKFNILLARCKEGIYFNDEAQKVNTVFVITGTRDERNFHLQALAAIAQIVQNSNFEKKWLKAKNIEALRDIVLLGDRRRKI